MFTHTSCLLRKIIRFNLSNNFQPRIFLNALSNYSNNNQRIVNSLSFHVRRVSSNFEIHDATESKFPLFTFADATRKHEPDGITLAHLYVRLKRHKWRLGDPRGAIETRVNARKVRQYFMDNFSPREVVSRNHCTKEGTAPCPVHWPSIEGWLIHC